MVWVLDASLALAWALPDKHSAAAEQAVERIGREDSLSVPALWWYEIANALTRTRRQARLSEADSLRALETYARLPLETDPSPDADLAWRLHSLAVEHGLSAYDAAYLELAQRRGAVLLTVDARLGRAASHAGVRVKPRLSRG